jgi:hypothetical protein
VVAPSRSDHCPADGVSRKPAIVWPEIHRAIQQS